jgi:hypothetical protein
MTHLQRLGAMAAFVNVIVAIATLAVVVFLIGIPAIADPSRLIDLAIHNPTPLFMADGLKVISAGTSGVLIWALANYLRRDHSALLSVATGFGMLSIVCLLGNAILSIDLIVQAPISDQGQWSGGQLNHMIGILAVAAISLEGLWLLLMSWSALKHQQLPGPLGYLGIGMGVLSLVPPLGILVLLLGMVWSVWIGQVLLKDVSAD